MKIFVNMAILKKIYIYIFTNGVIILSMFLKIGKKTKYWKFVSQENQVCFPLEPCKFYKTDYWGKKEVIFWGKRQQKKPWYLGFKLNITSWLLPWDFGEICFSKLRCSQPQPKNSFTFNPFVTIYITGVPLAFY